MFGFPIARVFRITLMLIPPIGIAAIIGCTPKPSVIFTLASGERVSVEAELAATPEARSLGLMFRTSLGEAEGMLFLFPEEQKLSFWMKDTYLPLDMIFINSGMSVVGIIENTVPLSTESRSVAAPAKFVLEVNRGFARAKGVTVGTRVEFQDVALVAR